jgi:hypothetical protein
MAIVKAHFSFYAKFWTSTRKRRPPQSGKYYRVTSIVFSYFIKKTNTYDGLF